VNLQEETAHKKFIDCTKVTDLSI